jgi:hypothetical protein
MIVAITRHPASLQGDGMRLLWFNICLLLAYAAAAFWLSRQSAPGVISSARVGLKFGVLLGGVHAANHLSEMLIVDRPFVCIIAPIFLMIALFGVTGSVGWAFTRSFRSAFIAAMACAMVGMLSALIAAFILNLTFEQQAASQLKGAFALSGLNDPTDFLVRNMLQAASEGLMRMPLLASLPSVVVAVVNPLLSKLSRRVVLALTYVLPILFMLGGALLWYADSMTRSARPPFIMLGVALTGVALSSAPAIWSTLSRTRHRPVSQTNKMA